MEPILDTVNVDTVIRLSENPISMTPIDTEIKPPLKTYYYIH